MEFGDNFRIADFKKLTLEEFHLYSLRATEKHKRRRDDHELLIELQRTWMSLYINSLTGVDGKKFAPTDFFKLSYDSEQKKDRKLTLKEAKELMGSKFKL